MSVAMDARLEYGVETGAEISLRRLSTLGVYNLPLCINATVHVSIAQILLFILFLMKRGIDKGFYSKGTYGNSPTPTTTIFLKVIIEFYQLERQASVLSAVERSSIH